MKKYRSLKYIVLTILIIFSSLINAEPHYTHPIDKVAYWLNTRPFYIGFSTGYGNTNWDGLVDPDAANDGSDISTPVAARGDGFAWGLLGGMELSPHFAIQGNFKRYPTSTLYFDQYNQYFSTAGSIETETENYSFVGKFMVPIFNTPLRLFSDLGPAYTYRKDVLRNTGVWAVTFGGGLNYLISQHFFAEVNFDYTSGQGKSSTNPVDSFIPFLYSINFALAYRFIA